jgi:general secretion pathway protein A
MYTRYYNFTQLPFAILPDPRFLYLSEAHNEALSRLAYGISGDERIMILTGESGTGKTILSHGLRRQTIGEAAFAIIPNPKITAYELLESVCRELGLYSGQGRGSIRAFVEQIHIYLLDKREKGQKTVILIDEAHNLDANVLKQLHILTALEAGEGSSLRIILVGRPELLEILNHPDLKEVSDSISGRYVLTPLKEIEVRNYINHRLRAAGNDSSKLFSDKAVRLIAKLTRGLPRSINLLADRALLAAFAVNADTVDVATVKRVGRDILPQRKRTGKFTGTRTMIGGGVLLCVAISMFFLFSSGNDDEGMSKSLEPAIAENIPAEPRTRDALSPVSAEKEQQGDESVAEVGQKIEPAQVELLSVETDGKDQEQVKVKVGDIAFLSSAENMNKADSLAVRPDPFMPPGTSEHIIRIAAPLLVLEHAGPVPQETVDKLLKR